jgi:hypothetical protein
MELNEKNITMFGTQGCSDCQRSKKVLEAHHVAFDFVDLEVITDAAALAEQLGDRVADVVDDIDIVVRPAGHGVGGGGRIDGAFLARDQHLTLAPRPLLAMLRHVGSLLRNASAWQEAAHRGALHGYAVLEGRLALGPLCASDAVADLLVAGGGEGGHQLVEVEV